MASRSCNSATIAFGMLGVAVKFYTAASEERIYFKTLTPNGHTVKRQYVDSETLAFVHDKDCLKGYEYQKGAYVTFSKEEVDSLDATSDHAVHVKYFLPLDAVDPIWFSKTYYLGPDKGMDMPYTLLAKALQQSGKAALCQWNSNGREHAVLLRGNEDTEVPGLLLHVLHYAGEVRAFENTCARVEVDEDDVQLAIKIINKRSKKLFDHRELRDTYNEKVVQMAEAKKAGKEIVIAPAAQLAPVVDLKAALKASMEAAEAIEDVKAELTAAKKAVVAAPKKTSRKAAK